MLSFIKKTLKLLLSNHPTEGLYYFVAEGSNVLNERWIGRLRSRRFICPLCGNSSSYFIHTSNRLRITWHSACPFCDSRSRHRGLLKVYQEIISKRDGIRLLHFAPEEVLARWIRGTIQIEYLTADLFLEDVDFKFQDIQKLTFPDNEFDVVLCNHVIEHVANDEAAISEIARILVEKGVAVITVPGDWSRYETVKFSDLSLNGHYRDYGMEIVEMLDRHFSRVEVSDMHRFDRDAGSGLSLGIKKADLAFICIK